MPDASFQLNNLEDKKKEKDLVLSKDENENSGPENAGIFVIY